nr:tetratricopeptide repeat protein [Candidatus Wallbacteria bacterium]
MSSTNGYERLIKFIKANPAFIKILGPEKIAGEIDMLVNGPGAESIDKVEYAEFLICSGLYERAAEALHGIIDADSANYRAHYLLARCYYMNGSLKEAQYPIIKCLEIQPNYDEGRLLLARIFLKARQYEKAQKLFEFYQNHPLYGVIAKLYIAKGYYYSGGFESAAAYLESLLKSGEKSPLFPAIYAYQLSNVEK